MFSFFKKKSPAESAEAPAPADAQAQPPALLARYEAEALQVALSDAFRSYLATQGYEPLAADGAQFARIVRDGLAKWERVVRERKIKVE